MIVRGKKEKYEIPMDEDSRRLTEFVKGILTRELSEVYEHIHLTVRDVDFYSLLIGATNAVTVRATAVADIFAKLNIQDVPREIRGYSVLGDLMPDHILPVLRKNEQMGTLLLPFKPGYENLHDIIKNRDLDDRTIIRVYDDFLKANLSVWIRTSKEERDSLSSEYLNRIRNRTRENMEVIKDMEVLGATIDFEEIFHMPVRVNEDEFPSLSDCVELVRTFLTENPIKTSVSAHKDEHAKNIIIDTISSDTTSPRWYLVDLPNASDRTDWVYSIGKMRHWWIAYYFVDEIKRLPADQIKGITFDVNKDGLQIAYNIEDTIPPICKTLDDMVKATAEWAGKYFNDVNWEERMYCSLFTALYGGITHHANPDHKHAIPILLGESVKALKPLI